MPTPEETEQLRKEEIRRAVLRYLAERPGISLLPAAIRRSLVREIHKLTEDEVIDALLLLKDLRYVKPLTEKLGATQYYRVTAEGTLHHERSN